MTTTTAPAAGTIAYVVTETGDTFGAVYGVYFDHEQAHLVADAIGGIVSVTEVRGTYGEPVTLNEVLDDVTQTLGRVSPRIREQLLRATTTADAVVVARRDGKKMPTICERLFAQDGLIVTRVEVVLHITA